MQNEKAQPEVLPLPDIPTVEDEQHSPMKIYTNAARHSCSSTHTGNMGGLGRLKDNVKVVGTKEQDTRGVEVIVKAEEVAKLVVMPARMLSSSMASWLKSMAPYHLSPTPFSTTPTLLLMNEGHLISVAQSHNLYQHPASPHSHPQTIPPNISIESPFPQTLTMAPQPSSTAFQPLSTASEPARTSSFPLSASCPTPIT